MKNLVTAKLKEFTIISHKNQKQEPSEIIIVMPSGDLSTAFDIAGKLLSKKKSVRLIGHGVTLKNTHPTWVSKAENFWLTELGAYQTRKIIETRSILRKDIESWLRVTFGEIITGCDTGKLFYGTVFNRFLGNVEMIGGILTFYEIVEFYGSKNYYCLQNQWENLSVYKIIVEKFRGNLKNAEDSYSSKKIKLLITGFATMGAVLLRQTLFYIQERASRLELKRLSDKSKAKPKTKNWVVSVADWDRMNLLVNKMVSLPLLERGERLGILLAGKLTPGKRVESNLKARTKAELWSGLGKLKNYLARCPVEQVVSATSIPELLTLYWRFIKKSSTAIFRAATVSEDQKTFNFDFTAKLFVLVKLLTQDIFDALAAEQATHKVIARYDFQDAEVIFPASGVMPFSAVDMVLQQAGAKTVDFIHGTSISWIGMIPSPSTKRLSLLRQNNEIVASPRQEIINTETQPIALKRSENRIKARNLLIVSNYCHRDVTGKMAHPYLPFQDELLNIVTVIRELFPTRFNFRWRPHPADLEPGIMYTLERFENVELSRGKSLEEDLEWADITFSSYSTVLYEALSFEMPVFLHALPANTDLPSILCFDPARRFYRATEIRQSFVECIKKLDENDPQALNFEKQIRQAWFGFAEEVGMPDKCKIRLVNAEARAKVRE